MIGKCFGPGNVRPCLLHLSTASLCSPSTCSFGRSPNPSATCSSLVARMRSLKGCVKTGGPHKLVFQVLQSIPAGKHNYVKVARTGHWMIGPDLHHAPTGPQAQLCHWGVHFNGTLHGHLSTGVIVHMVGMVMNFNRELF